MRAACGQSVFNVVKLQIQTFHLHVEMFQESLHPAILKVAYNTDPKNDKLLSDVFWLAEDPHETKTLNSSKSLKKDRGDIVVGQQLSLNHEASSLMLVVSTHNLLAVHFDVSTPHKEFS